MLDYLQTFSLNIAKCKEETQIILLNCVEISTLQSELLSCVSIYYFEDYLHLLKLLLALLGAPGSLGAPSRCLSRFIGWAGPDVKCSINQTRTEGTQHPVTFHDIVHNTVSKLQCIIYGPCQSVKYLFVLISYLMYKEKVRIFSFIYHDFQERIHLQDYLPK